MGKGGKSEPLRPPASSALVVLRNSCRSSSPARFSVLHAISLENIQAQLISAGAKAPVPAFHQGQLLPSQLVPPFLGTIFFCFAPPKGKQSFLNEEVGGITIADWALSFGEIGLAVYDKKIVIPKPFADKLGEFARWVAGKYGTKPGVNQVYGEIGSYATLQDGSKFYLSTIVGQYPATIGTTFTVSDTPLVFSTGYYIVTEQRSDRPGIYATRFFSPDGVSLNSTGGFEIASPICLAVRDNRLAVSWFLGSSWSIAVNVVDLNIYPFLNSVAQDESFSLDVSDTMQQVLDRLTALEEGQSIALDVGATQSMEIQEILQGILDAILAGDLAASAEIVDTAEVPVEPDLPVLPVVPEGLDKLGAALTSRFPFSIPWDIKKGVTLLAAPPKAPYFEVDFMAPIADRVGGWKGSTKIVLDFSEYEIIGQVCRWTSTIGFCLMLASGTKRLIWTA